MFSNNHRQYNSNKEATQEAIQVVVETQEATLVGTQIQEVIQVDSNQQHLILH